MGKASISGHLAALAAKRGAKLKRSGKKAQDAMRIRQKLLDISQALQGGLPRKPRG